MSRKKHHISYQQVASSELSPADRTLIEAAQAATYRSYAPYSNFRVGAAAKLSNGEVLTGSNQENASFTTGTCAERCLVFHANAEYPEAAVEVIAIAARNSEGQFTLSPISPCGACRQVLSEVELRYEKPIRVLLYGTDFCYIFDSIKDLLPFGFDSKVL